MRSLERKGYFCQRFSVAVKFFFFFFFFGGGGGGKHPRVLIKLRT